MPGEETFGTSRTGPGVGQDQEFGFLVLHGTDLARALAGGAIFPRSKEWAGFVTAVGKSELRDVLEAVRRGREYGVVAIVEVKQGHLVAMKGQGSADRPQFHYLPLAMVSRIVFESDEDADEFHARASGYADVPADVLQYHVEPSLFARQTATNLVDQGNWAGNAGHVPAEEVLAGPLAVDKLAGTITGFLVGAIGPAGEVSCLAMFTAACKSLRGPVGAGALVRALALQIDPEPGNMSHANLAGMVAGKLATLRPGDGFDAEAFIEELVATLPEGTEEAEVATKYAEWALAVLSGRADIGDDGFADCLGEIAARALLLFSLNPDASRLQSVGKRLGVVGSSVRMLACALAGSLAGFASLPATIKARNVERYLAIPLLAKSLALGESARFFDTHSLGPTTGETS